LRALLASLGQAVHLLSNTILATDLSENLGRHKLGSSSMRYYPALLTPILPTSKLPTSFSAIASNKLLLEPSIRLVLPSQKIALPLLILIVWRFTTVI